MSGGKQGDRSLRYSELGVSALKEEVHEAIKVMGVSARPNAFCRVSENFFSSVGGTGDHYYLQHADGAGSKSVLAYLYWKESGDVRVFRSLLQDAYVMNIDDALMVGGVNEFGVTSTILRNRGCIPGEVLREIIIGGEAFLDFLSRNGVVIRNQGGETADIGDLVRTLCVDAGLSTFIRGSDFIDAGNIMPGQVIVGFGSSGRSEYERGELYMGSDYNSGIGANGLTLARHVLMGGGYREYRESYGGESGVVYKGEHGLMDRPFRGLAGYGGLPLWEREAVGDLDIGRALLSPTRTYLPLVREFMPLIRGKKVSGLMHLTGGGQTKPLRFGGYGGGGYRVAIEYIKDSLFEQPPLFELIMERVPMREFFSVFNGGHRLEAYTDEATARELIGIARSVGIRGKVVGRTGERALSVEEEGLRKRGVNCNILRLSYKGETYSYTL